MSGTVEDPRPAATQEDLQFWFDHANAKYFKRRLKNVTVMWRRPDKNSRTHASTYSPHKVEEGEERYFIIKMNPSLRRWRTIAIMTLLHEMVHVEQWEQVSTKTCHGRLFEKRMKHLAAIGAFKGLW